MATETHTVTRTFRPFQFASALALIKLVLLTSLSFGADNSPDQWTILEQSSDGLTIEVQIPRPLLRPGLEAGWTVLKVRGTGRGLVAGAPDLPFFTRKIAVPAGRLVVVSVLSRTDGSLLSPVLPQPVPDSRLVEARTDRQTAGLPVSDDQYEPDPALYATPYPESWVSVVDRGRLRFLEIATIAVHPYRWIPSLNGIRLAERLVVRVDFVEDPAAARAPQTQIAVPRDHRSWDTLLRNQILNSDDATRFRSRPALLPRAARATHRAGGNAPEYRLGILRSGIQKVGFDDLPAATGPWPLNQVAIFEKGYAGSESPYLEIDVPSWIDDKNGNGQFDSGDHLYFYGQNYPDRFLPTPRNARYGNEHAYWMTIRDEGGVRTQERGSTLDRTDLTPEASSVSTIRIARNRHFRRFLTHNESRDVSRGTGAIYADHTIWLGLWPTFGNPDADEFDLPGFLSARNLTFLVHHFERTPTTSYFRVRIGGAAQGAYDLPRFTQHDREVTLHAVAQDELSHIPFREARNYIGVEIEVGEQAAGIEAMECEYNQSFRAFQNRMNWNTDNLTGDREFVLHGFDSDAFVVFDVSDPQRPVRLTYDPQQIIGPGRLRLQMNTTGKPLTLEAVTESGALRPDTIKLRTLADLWGTPEHEFLIVVHHEFAETLEPYVSERRAQGWNLEVVKMRDLADIFDHGRSSPLAIRRYLRYLFASLESPPSYLLLVGDGSEDHRQAEEFVGRIFVPTQTIPAEAYLHSDGYEISVSDHWFVDNLTEETETLDFLPDMHVGRLPVKTKTELETMIAKIHAYEQFGTDEPWRSRLLFVADDEFSTTLAASESYQYRGNRPSGGESVFRYAARESRRIIHESPGFENLQVDSLFLATYLDTFACAERCILVDDTSPDCTEQVCRMDEFGEADGFRGGTANLDWAERQTRLVVMPTLRQMKNRGYLLVSVQSHANRHLIAHEGLWLRAPGRGEDHRALENVGKPFIYLGFGCHMSEFGEHQKQRSGNSLVEAMMYLPDGRGCIAGIASGSYEWLNANNEYQEAIAQTWFADPPTDSAGRARWILGEMFTASKLDLIGRRSGSGMVASYGLLGDPTLTVEIGAPRLQEVRVNGVNWDGSERVQAQPDSDSLQIDVTLFDEVWIQSIEIFANHGPVPPSDYELSWPVGTADGDTLFREAVITYRTELDVPDADYDIVVRGTDRNGLSREVAFPITFNARFEVERKGSRQPLRPGEFIAGRDSVFVTVTSPVDLDSGLFIQLNGESIPARGIRLDNAGREWELATELPPSLGRNSRIRIGIGVVNRAGATVERSIEALTASAEVDITSLFNFPNPFRKETVIMYRLSAFAVRAQVRVFTLRGREIRSLEGTATLGDNEIAWDGIDADGDAVANGVYFYQLEVESVTGHKIKRIERIARTR